MTDSEAAPGSEPVEIPYVDLSAQALRGVVESFVLREGTDYGASEIPFVHKVEQVLRQLRSGEARIVFDPVTESVDVQPARVAQGSASKG